MSYGELKIDTITFTAGGVDSSISVSGLVQNPTFTGNITTTGTVTASFVEASNTISGAVITGGDAGFGTITGDTAGFTTVTGTTVTGTTANFVTVSGTVVTGTTANFVTVSGTTVTGNTGQFTNITGVNIVGTTEISGATVTGGVGLFGTLGVGTSNPQGTLNVQGSTAAPSLTYNTADIVNLDAGTIQLAIGVASSAPFGAYLQGRDTSNAARVISLNPAGGDVGIGVASPDVNLHISGTGSPALRIQDSDGTNQYLNVFANNGLVTVESRDGAGDGSFRIRGGATTNEYLRIDSAGRLLLGESSAWATGDADLLAIQSQFGGNVDLRRDDASVVAGNQLGAIRFWGNAGDSGEAVRIEAEADGAHAAGDKPGRLIFLTTPGGTDTPVERMRITSDGELLVGYTSDNGNYKLQVNSQIFATNATIATSDGRYKENVASLGGCLDLVKALRPVSFTWKPQEDITRIDDEGNEVLVREGHNFPEGTQVGFIAQEVQEVLDGKPWLSSVIKENVRPAVKDNEGNELAPEERFYGIAEGNLIAVLTNALQEAVGRIETLEAEVAALEGN